jgi:hypothetical protein
LNKYQFLQESSRNARNSWGILGFSIFFEQVSIPSGIHQESSRTVRNSWGILGFSILFEQVSIPPGILQDCQEFLGNFGFLNII